MDPRAKPKKVQTKARRPVARKSPKDDSAKVRDLEERLAEALKREGEALEQQTAASEVLRAISSSPTDIQRVLDTVVESATRLCESFDAVVFLRDGNSLRQAAHHGPVPVPPVVPLIRGTSSGRAVLDGRTVHVGDLQAEADEFPEGARLARLQGHLTVLSVPLNREGTAIGTIHLRRTEARPFTDKQVTLLQTFADQAVIAIENVRLFKELEASNRDLAAALDRQTGTADILRAISQAQTDVRPAFEAIADSAMRLLAAWSVMVYRCAGDRVRLAAARGGHPGSSAAIMARLGAQWSRSENAALRRTVLTRTVLKTVDVEMDKSWGPESREQARERGWRSAIHMPMLRGGDIVGVIAVSRAEAGEFSLAEIALLQTFADQAVIAVENARLLSELHERTGELQRSVDQLTALGEVGQAVSSSLDLETVLTTIVSRAVEISGLDGGTIFEYDQGAEQFVQRALTATARVLPADRPVVGKGEGVVGRTAATLEPVQVPDIAVDGTYEGRLRESLIAFGVRAILAVPIIREGHLLGGLVVNRKQPGEFPPETIDLLRTFATQSALAIQNARLFQELADKSRELEAASRHKSEFLANMSHELRTPLNAIIGFSEILAEKMFGDINEKQTEYLQDILESGRHLLSLINDILDLSKIEAGRMELELSEFDLPNAIDNALILVRERASRRGIRLESTIDERLGMIGGDERKVKQVLLNLLSNALKFTPEGGRIDVRAGVHDEVAEVSVTDTGVGIAPEDQEAVFEEFRQVGTADKKVEGTGLGLALTRKFIELHGGRIWVTSAVAVGSTFTFTLPVRREEPILLQ